MDPTLLIPPNVTPQVGLATSIAVGGTAVLVFPPGVYGGYIVNPLSTADQGISPVEPLYINPFTVPTLNGFGTTSVIAAGAMWSVPIAKSTIGVWVNATTTGHRFTAVYWIGP